MNANVKSTEAPPERPVAAKPEARETPPAVVFASLFHNGMVRFAEIQKSAIDQIVQHNAEFQAAWKQTYKAPSAPAAMFMDLAGQGIEKVAAVQKSLMDLTIEHSALLMDMSKDGAEGTAKRANGIADIVRQSTDKLIAAEKVVLNFAAEQNVLVTERIKKQFGLADAAPAVAAVESVRRGMEVAIDAQKEMIDLAAKPIKAAAAAAAKSA